MMSDPDLKIMRNIFKPGFFKEWNIGIKSYIAGDWETACSQFELTSNYIPGYSDKPSRTLLEIMNQYQNEAPTWWEGYRPLTEK